MHVYLADLSNLAQRCRESSHQFERFRAHPAVVALRWPADVVEQWLYDHADNGPFLHDYGRVELSSVTWDVEILSIESLLTIPTGPSDEGAIDDYASNPDHWISVRSGGVHLGVAQCWQAHGTWKRWPILIERSLLGPSLRGLQVVEGRTRVGILRGRHRNGDFVAPRHLAWVGRARLSG